MNFHVVCAVAPLALLLWLMLKPSPWKAARAIPVAALLLVLLQGFYFGMDPTLLGASVVQGALTAWTPIIIVAGAIFLFECLEASGHIGRLQTQLQNATSNPVAQVLLIGWAFAYFVEGASGFGTPVALAAPLLVRLGFDPIKSLLLCLVMNSVPVSFGAVGLPTWFGLGQNLSLDAQTIAHIGFQSALIHAVAGLFIPFMALGFLFPVRTIRRNFWLILGSTLLCIVPSVGVAWLGNSEFPSLVGGMVGLVGTFALARMLEHGQAKDPKRSVDWGELGKATLPLAAVVGILILTRVEVLGVQNTITALAPAWGGMWEAVGTIGISAGGVIFWQHILGTELSWSHALLYIPSFVPFGVVGVGALIAGGVRGERAYAPLQSTLRRMKSAVIALTAALILVKLLLNGGDNAPAHILGQFLARLTGDWWVVFAPLLGALGSFFSGSNTVSNLTFGGLQLSVAQQLDLPMVTILALQNVGGAMGNMVCIANIIAGCSVLGIREGEGTFLRHTVRPMAVYAVLAALMGVGLIWWG